MSAAGGTQRLPAINTMEFEVRALREWAVPYVVPVAAAGRVFDSAGRIQDESIELQLMTLAARSSASRNGSQPKVRFTARPSVHVRPKGSRALDNDSASARAARKSLKA
jgi:hypothetical protein